MSFRGPDEPAIGGSGGDWLGATIGAGATLYDSYQDRKLSRETTDKTIAASKSESELAYQRSVDMWNAQNLYNSPQAQMQRFKEAGLNPHLIYGQGNAGNASSTPEYQPARMDYSGYKIAPVGPALNSILPTLMSVGSWMQNMRATEVDIQKGKMDTLRVEQLIDYLTQQNPQLLKERHNKLLMFETQAQMQNFLRDQAEIKMKDMSTEFRYKYGDDLWKQSGVPGPAGKIEGLKRLKFMQEFSREKLLEAQSSWADFDITNPQAIMQLVLQGVMGMAGASLRLRPGAARPATSQKARPTGVRRIHPSRRVQQKKGRIWD